MRKAIAAVMALAMPRKPPPNAFAQAAMLNQAGPGLYPHAVEGCTGRSGNGAITH
jgi:hypothetical protein